MCVCDHAAGGSYTVTGLVEALRSEDPFTRRCSIEDLRIKRSESAQEAVPDRGVEFHTGVAVTGAEAGRDGRVAEVHTDVGRFEVDFVLVAAGIRPAVDLATSGGLRIGDTGAIWVNQQQQTSHEAVWAAGDCAEAYHRVLRRNTWIPLGTTANKQGRIAGANIVGAGQNFRGIVGTAGFVVFE